MSITVGASLTPFRIDAKPEAMQSWARFLRDPNPLHLDPAAVAARGLGDRVINQGPANLAYVINMLLQTFPTATIDTLDVRYVDNVFGGDVVEATGAVTSIVESGGQQVVTCEIALRAEGRGPVITGSAVLSIPS